MTPDYTLSRNFSGNVSVSYLLTLLPPKNSIVVRLITVKVHCHFHIVSISRTRARPTRRTGHRITARGHFFLAIARSFVSTSPTFPSADRGQNRKCLHRGRVRQTGSRVVQYTHARTKERANVRERNAHCSEVQRRVSAGARLAQRDRTVRGLPRLSPTPSTPPTPPLPTPSPTPNTLFAA